MYNTIYVCPKVAEHKVSTYDTNGTFYTYCVNCCKVLSYTSYKVDTKLDDPTFKDKGEK